MTLVQSIEAMAVLVNAISGFVEARSKKMDVVGVVIKNLREIPRPFRSGRDSASRQA